MTHSQNQTLSPRAAHWIDHLDHTQKYDIDLITQACLFASEYDTQETPFALSTLTQGLEMADTLITLQCDSTAIASAILYPTIYYHDELKEKFFKTIDHAVVKIVLGATKIESIHQIRAQSNQIERLRKMLLAMVDDIRTILLKLAERLFLLKHCNKASQKKLAQETMDFYAPLANRLGIGQIKWQLEDWAFQYLHPMEYQAISHGLKMRHEDRIRVVHKMIFELKELLDKHHLKNTKISGRIKHIYSIYKKTQRKKITLEKIYDASAVRILLPTVQDCYTALSIVHNQWKPIVEEFDDYIAHPKQNGYQSIHTAIIRDRLPIEIQIRTIDMHERAELGVAAHWKYKENNTSNTEEEKILLLRELLDFQDAISTNASQQKLYEAAFHDRVYVFSPNGDVYDLKAGATPLDFAYLVHTNIGHRCKGAKINGVLVPLTHELKTGDRIHIMTTKAAHPSRDWLRSELGYLKTLHAIRKVRQWFYKIDNEKPAAEEKEKAPITELIHAEKKPEKITESHTDFSVAGTKHLLTQLARCCHPIPGDAIIGYITTGRGITVHRNDCKNIKSALEKKQERMIQINWENQGQKKFRVTLAIEADDRAGLIRDISSVIAKQDVSILSMTSRISSSNRFAIIELTVDINNLTLLKNLQHKIKQVGGIQQVVRK